MALKGHFEHTLDAKHRLSIPSRWRNDFSSGLVLAKDADACIAVWTPTAHESTFERATAGINPLSRSYKQTQRFFMSNSFDSPLDGAGRVTLPQALLDHAGLEKEVVVAGVGDHLEIWARERWLEDQASLSASIGEVTESLGHPA